MESEIIVTREETEVSSKITDYIDNLEIAEGSKAEELKLVVTELSDHIRKTIVVDGMVFRFKNLKKLADKKQENLATFFSNIESVNPESIEDRCDEMSEMKEKLEKLVKSETLDELTEAERQKIRADVNELKWLIADSEMFDQIDRNVIYYQGEVAHIKDLLDKANMDVEKLESEKEMLTNLAKKREESFKDLRLDLENHRLQIKALEFREKTASNKVETYKGRLAVYEAGYSTLASTIPVPPSPSTSKRPSRDPSKDSLTSVSKIERGGLTTSRSPISASEGKRLSTRKSSTRIADPTGEPHDKLEEAVILALNRPKHYPQMPIFTGEDNEDVYDWLETIEENLDIANEYNDKNRIRVASSKMKGCAKLICRQVRTSLTKQTWTQFKIDLIKALQPPTLQTELRNEIEKLRQGTDMRVYIKEFLKLVAKIDPIVENEKIHFFRKGLTKEARDYLAHHHHQSSNISR